MNNNQNNRGILQLPKDSPAFQPKSSKSNSNPKTPHQNAKKSKIKAKELALSDVMVTKIDSPRQKPKETKESSSIHVPTVNAEKLHGQIKWTLSLNNPSNDGPFYYATQLVNQVLDNVTKQCMTQLSKAQTKLVTSSSNPVPVYRRRFCQGVTEVGKHLARTKVKLVILVKNVDVSDNKVMKRLNKILDCCHVLCIPLVFSMTKKQLGETIHAKSVATVGIFSLEGINYRDLLNVADEYERLWRAEFCRVWSEGSIPSNPHAPHGESPLWIAAFYNYRDPKILAQCVENGWDVNAPDSYYGYTPLLVACKHYHHFVVANLLGVNLLEMEEFNKYILKQIKLWNLVKGQLDWSEKLEALKVLKRQDVDLTLKSFSGENCLHLAIGSPLIIACLLQRAKKDGVQNQLLSAKCFGKTPLQLSVEQCDAVSFSLLYTPEASNQLLELDLLHHVASLHFSSVRKAIKHRDMLRTLLAKLDTKGLDSRLKSGEHAGMTPLMLACVLANTDSVMVILSHLCPPTSEEPVIVEKKKVKPTTKVTVEQLMATATLEPAKPKSIVQPQPTKTKKPKKSKKKSQPPSPYPTFMANSNSRAIVNATDEQNRTSLWWAAWRGNWDIVKMLLDAGADKTIADSEGKVANDVVGQWSFEEPESDSDDEDDVEIVLETPKETLQESDPMEQDSSSSSESEEEIPKPHRPRIRRRDIQQLRLSLRL